MERAAVQAEAGKNQASRLGSTVLLQRQCACGTQTMGGGQCAECQKKKLGISGRPLQAKLTISEAGDAYEQEADRVAEQVMRMSPSDVSKRQNTSSMRPLVQRRPSGGATGLAEAPPSVHNVLNSPGRPLEPVLQQDMEQRFGQDFSRVRVHTDAEAARSARDVSARAYTTGSHIVFGAGNFVSETQAGRELLAHELTHVLQQRSGAVQRKVQRNEDEATSHLSQELIPSATLTIDLSGALFKVSPEAIFQPGPKTIQLIRIALRLLLQDQYTDKLAVELTLELESRKKQYQRSGHFQHTRDAFEGEKIEGFHFSVEPFMFILKFIEGKELKIHLSDEQLEHWQAAFANRNLWSDINRIAREEGMPLPKWYVQPVFIQHMTSRTQALQVYKKALFEFRATGDAAAKSEGRDAATNIFYDIYGDVALLESIRKDVSLYKDPESQAAYQAIWYLTDKTREAGQPAPILRSIENAFALLEFSRKHEHLRINAEFYPEMRRELIVKLIKENGFAEHNLKLLPPYPAFIVAPDLNQDNSTVDTATNVFRLITSTEAVHGDNLLHGTTIAMARSIYYTWEVGPLPDSLKYMKNDAKMGAKDLVKEADAFVKNSPQNLKLPIKKYSASRDDYEHSVKMKGFGLGDFLLVGRAAPHYREDMHWVQQPSTAGYPFSIFDAKTLATNSAFAEWDQLQSLKNQQEKATTQEEKNQYKEEIDRMTVREGSDLLQLNKKDLKDGEKLVEAAKRLKLFIEYDRKKNIPMQGNATTDPFIIRLKNFDSILHDVYLMIREMYDPRRYDDLKAIDEYVALMEAQNKELKKTGTRIEDAYTRFKPGSPTYRVIAALVKEDDGNAVPLLLVAGYHPDADPGSGKHKIKLVDVTFNGKKSDMIYIGGTKGSEQEAVQSAFVEFGEDNNYGHGKIVYRLPQTPYQGQADSVRTAGEYLQYALAAFGIIMLVLGTIATAGALSPVATGVVTALGVSLAVVSAAMSIRNMEKRKEKGTFEMDTETALDIVNIVGAAVVAVGTVSRIAMAARATTLARVLIVQRLEKLIAVYDMTELGANVYLMSVKVKEDVEAIKKLGLPKHEEEQMISSIVFDALQQGAMIGISARSTLKQIPNTFKTRVETSPYKSWQDKGWIKLGDKGKVEITDSAPPFLQQLKAKVGTAPPPDHQGKMAHKATVVEPFKQGPTEDGQHTLTLTERGRIIRCSDFCQDLRAKYEKILAQDPDANKRLLEIEAKAATAAKNNDEVEAKKVFDEAKKLEGTLRWTEQQWHKFTKTAADEDPRVDEPIEFSAPKAEAKSTPGKSSAGGTKAAKPGRVIELTDLLTESEFLMPGGMQKAAQRLGNVMGQTMSDIPVFKKHWDEAVKKVLNGKAVTDYKPDEVNNKLFPKANREFWQRVAKDPEAVAFLEGNGFSIGKRGGEPSANLGPVGKAKGKKAADSQENRVQILPKDQADDWRKALDADNLALSFKQPAAAKSAPVKKPALVLSPDERRLATHGKSLGMLDSEVELYIQQFRKHSMPVEDMEQQMAQWAETLKANPKAKARMAPDFIMDAKTRAKLPDFEQKIAGTGGIEKITARDAPIEGGLAITIEGTILPQRLARRKKDVSKTRRRAPEFNQSDKLFSNKEAGLDKKWQRLHLWGPGFGDEAAAGMMWGPKKVNLVWQNDSIESYIRQLATLNDARGGTTRVKATAIAWENPAPGGFKQPQGEHFLKRAEYVITLQRPGQPDTTIRVTLDVAPPPKSDIAEFSIHPPHAANLGEVL